MTVPLFLKGLVFEFPALLKLILLHSRLPPPHMMQRPLSCVDVQEVERLRQEEAKAARAKADEEAAAVALLDGDQKSEVVSTIVRFRQTQPLTSVPDRGLRTQSQGLCLRLKLS